MEKKLGQNLKERLKNIKLLALDCDGILTDTRIFYRGDGRWARSFSIRDGLGLQRIQEEGLLTALITSSQSEDIRERAKVLKFNYFYEGKGDKHTSWQDLLTKTKLLPSEVAYMGDDEMDIPFLEQAGFSATVSDAMESVLEKVHYITKRPAGLGAVREVCELILNVQRSV